MSAVGVILALAFHYIPSSEHVVRAILFTALAWFTLTMMHLSYKVRHFQIERSACIEAIEHECLMGFTVPYDTEGAKKYAFRKEKRFERWFYEVRSYHLAYIMYIGIIAMLLYLAYIESPCIAIVAIVLFIIIFIIISWRRRGDKDGEVKHNRS
jgi:L-asparagine transporter-like permease